MKSYPLMTFERMLFWSVAARIRKIRPFWYMEYSKEAARALLEREYGWEYYGGHHLENRMTAFFHSVYAPQKFDSDFRNNTPLRACPPGQDVARGGVARILRAHR